VLAVEVEDAEGTGGYGSMASAKIVQELKAKGVYARPLGNVVYLLASQVASQEIVQTLIDALENVLRHRAENDGEKDTSAEAGATNGVVI
jgi:dethiobiotin synthetase/adenosylmethionine--8-amino-7-oxononanoate aminotransferase